jgi:hypothetical protein
MRLWEVGGAVRWNVAAQDRSFPGDVHRNVGIEESAARVRGSVQRLTEWSRVHHVLAAVAARAARRSGWLDGEGAHALSALRERDDRAASATGYADVAGPSEAGDGGARELLGVPEALGEPDQHVVLPRADLQHAEIPAPQRGVRAAAGFSSWPWSSPCVVRRCWRCRGPRGRRALWPRRAFPTGGRATWPRCRTAARRGRRRGPSARTPCRR